MIDPKLRFATPEDFASILALNESVVKWTSPLDRKKLAQLHDWSNHHKVITINDQVAAFLLVMPVGVAYDSPNYLWFSQRYENFLYVDRIVVDATFVGMKIGGLLYQDLFKVALSHGIQLITCEYNSEPINQGSQIFHQRFGFKEVGKKWLKKNTKQVSYQAAKTDK